MSEETSDGAVRFFCGQNHRLDAQTDFQFFSFSSTERYAIVEHLRNYRLEANEGFAFYVVSIDANVA